MTTWQPRGPTVIEQLERFMRETPHAPAIVTHEGATTYRELDVTSRRVAAQLRARGVGPDRTVAVIADRGVPQIVGLIGVLRAGGAYVPIKPSLPRERIGWILEEVKPAVILCDGQPPSVLEDISAEVIRLDDSAPDSEFPELAPVVVPPDALAYIIHTSGSTGRPKGVMVTRRGFDAQMRWIQEAFPLDARDRCLQLHAFTFDASVSEIFWPLIVGGAIVLPRVGGELDSRHLDDLIAKSSTTVVHFVPTMMWALLESIDAAKWQGVKWLIAGGEALTVELVRRCAHAFPRAELVNTYGPTETTVNATFARCADDGRAVAIGVPVADTTGYVLDDNLLPVPLGAIGELWLGGVQLARGYLHKPALTAERFVPDPFAARPGERIYKTGDLVRQNDDGVLEYVGRADFQVKVRGFRIELGEIESVLREHPQVRNAAVVDRDDRFLGRHLVAYVCATDSTASEALRAFLAERLPDYMVPMGLVLLDELPLTTSGKLDRRALPVPTDDAYRRAAYLAPSTEAETALATMFTEVLGVERVGINDNFFELGGHSLLAMRLIARIRRHFDVELTLMELFDGPTISQIAAHVGRTHHVGSQRGSVERLSHSEGPACLLQPYWFTVQQVDPEIGPSIVLHDIWRLSGQLDPLLVERAWQAVGVRHQVLRTNYTSRDGEVRQIVRPPEPPFLPSCEHLDWSARTVSDSEGALDEAVLTFVRRPFDVGNGPIAKILLIRITPEDHVMVLMLHQLVFDGPTSEMVDRELADAYRVLQADPSLSPASVVAPLPFQFLDVAAYLASYRNTPAGNGDREYWLTRFDGLEPLQLPTDFPRDPVDAEAAAKQVATGKAMVAQFPAAAVRERDDTLGELIVTAARRENVPVLAYLLAGLAELFHSESGQTDIALQTSLNVRPLLDAEPLMGGFNSPIYVRIDLSDHPSRRRLLSQVRSAISDAYSHALIQPLDLVPAHAARVNLGFGVALDNNAGLRIGDALGTAISVPGSMRPAIPFNLRPHVAFAGTSGLIVSFAYNTRLFKHETVERLCRRYITVLRAMAEQTDAPVGSHPGQGHSIVAPVTAHRPL